MKFKALLLILLGSMSSIVMAEQHAHPNLNPNDQSQQASKNSKQMTYPGSCEIELLNHSSYDVRVNGVFDDGISLIPFNIYSYDAAQYISLYYYGYCHDGMDLYIDTFFGTSVYAGYVPRYTTIRIVNSLFGQNKLQATVHAKV